ncbi:hypothetical protein E2562_024818 [Oryza meyeriana var. granulata]|uniref:Uncharacterized protein n=1 Tax=Oryza meyeriana var. granulata TaxID=110450 RepID=A0A6G1FBV7_9ORYZ|nr:hypothetical protein E2562_024818 [Oryza meyeriana var. granulata]
MTPTPMPPRERKVVRDLRSATAATRGVARTLPIHRDPRHPVLLAVRRSTAGLFILSMCSSTMRPAAGWVSRAAIKPFAKIVKEENWKTFISDSLLYAKSKSFDGSDVLRWWK